MSDSVKDVEYRYTVVQDEPGEGLRVLEALRNGGVNLLAVLGFPLGDGRSQIDLVPEDPEALVAVAEQAGVRLSTPKKAILIQGDDRIGAAEEHLRKLAEHEINVTAVAAVAAGSGRYGMVLWVKPEDYERATRALSE
ncbi:MAG: hypothetical protein C4318_03865 [Acidimicrobiia bacterium]